MLILYCNTVPAMPYSFSAPARLSGYPLLQHRSSRILLTRCEPFLSWHPGYFQLVFFSRYILLPTEYYAAIRPGYFYLRLRSFLQELTKFDYILHIVSVL
jgi:hypothetical protein